MQVLFGSDCLFELGDFPVHRSHDALQKADLFRQLIYAVFRSQRLEKDLMALGKNLNLRIKNEIHSPIC